MVKRVFSLLDKLAMKFNGGSTVDNLVVEDDRQSPCQSAQGNQHELHEIDKLKSEVKALELAAGKLIVDRERYWHKTRLKTIAKRHMQNLKNQKYDQWVREGRALARYFATAKENDAVVAEDILSPCLSSIELRGGLNSISTVRL
jgi:hypothetical protein